MCQRSKYMFLIVLAQRITMSFSYMDFYFMPLSLETYIGRLEICNPLIQECIRTSLQNMFDKLCF